VANEPTREGAATTTTTATSRAEQDKPTVLQPSIQEIQKSPAYGFWLAVISLALVSLVAFSAMLIFQDVFQNATDVTTVLSSLFAVVGTVVGTYFGIKTSADTRDNAQGTIEKANEIANRALAELPPEVGRRVASGG
jgi:hypothetical protein